MQIDVVVAARAAGIEVDPEDRETEAKEEPLVAFNDNGMRWPFVPFPEGWCASC